jgi:hypothetical protein
MTRWIGLLAASVLVSACGWHAGLVVPAGAQTIGVEAVRRRGEVLERGLEPELTDALSRAVVDWVEVPLAAPDRADLVLRAEILDYRRRGGVRSSRNELIETAVFVSASAQLFDREGRPVGNPATAQEWSGFALDERANEDEARRRVLRQVASALVLDLFTPAANPDEAPEELGASEPFP